MKKLRKLIPLFLIGAILFSCQKETIDQPQNHNEITPEVLEKIASLELNTDGVRFETFTNPDGSVSQGYVVENCYLIPPKQLDEMQIYEGDRTKQYRTYNTLPENITINVLGYTGNHNDPFDDDYVLTSKMRTGLQRAINNYNSLAINLTFNLDFGYITSDYDIIVHKEINSSAGAIAGFPSNSKPYKWVKIYSGLNSYDLDVHEHVITHEIGHCIGLRHSDWKTRESCGYISGEPANPYGAVHIPGTPTGYDPTSIMNACFSGDESGEFNSNDKIALYYLYNYKMWLIYHNMPKKQALSTDK